MARKVEPAQLGLYVNVYRPDSMHLSRSLKRWVEGLAEQQDADGFTKTFQMEEWKSHALIGLTIRRGVPREDAARLLREIADRIEGLSIDLLSLRPWMQGHFIGDEADVCDVLAVDLNEDGTWNTELPKVL